MIQEITKDFYLAKIPLPKSPLKDLNCYIIKDSEYNLLIDTGFNQPECKQALLEAAAELKLDWHRTILFITHLHSDHCGLAYFLQGLGARVISGRVDGERLNSMFESAYWDFFGGLMRKYDLERFGITKHDHPGYAYRPENQAQIELLDVGEKIKTGKYEFELIDLAGHTPGQVGLLETSNKFLFVGDHMLATITPNIVEWTVLDDSLGLYMRNLQKVHDMDLNEVFPAHRELITDYRARAKGLLKHHELRLNSVREIIKKGRQSVSEVASQMEWEIRAKSWFDFPKGQKWFSSGEAASHLRHLCVIGELEQLNIDGIDYYEMKQRLRAKD